MKAFFLSLEALAALLVFALALALFLPPPAPAVQELYAFQLAGDAAEITLRSPRLRSALEAFLRGDDEAGERAGVLVQAYSSLLDETGPYCVTVETDGREASTCAVPRPRSASVQRWLDDGARFVRVRFTASYG